MFLIFLFIFFILLFNFNSLQLWFDQSLAQITIYAGETKHTELYNTITSYVGEYGFIILKIFYYLVNSALSLFNISKFENIIFVLFIVVNFIFFYFFIKKIKYLRRGEKIFIHIFIGIIWFYSIFDVNGNF